MFAAVVREGMLVRTPSGRIAQVLWSVPGEGPHFFEIEYADNGEKGVIHCRLMRIAPQPCDLGGIIIGDEK